MDFCRYMYSSMILVWNFTFILVKVKENMHFQTIFLAVVCFTCALPALCVRAENILNPEHESKSSVPRSKPVPTNREKLIKRLCRRCSDKPCEVSFSGGFVTVICFCKSPCLNEAKCNEKGKCQCPPGFSGEDCGIPDINATCSALSCHNGGYCLDYDTEGHHCSCPVQFSGQTCQRRYEHLSDWCNEECGKRNRICKPHFHGVDLIDFECLEQSEPCRVGPNCKNGYCEKNSTNDCICKECWNGKYCDFYCCKKCRNGGRCIMVDGRETCECPSSPIFYTGELCEDIRRVSTVGTNNTLPEESELQSTYKYILIASGFTLLLLIIALVTIPYFLWKKRVLWIMKIVYKFQSPVEVGIKEYHAFVSYCGSKTDGGESPDERFVLEKLQKKLEEEHSFRLCLHYRDFLPGIAIAENIIHAVENSHRTILVLSRRFVESEWCQLEYQKAQHEMLMRRHKIIPVIFEQIDQSDIKDKNLLDILKAVTYIEWPGDEADPKSIQHFWKKVVYSMPKKGGKSLESYPSTSSGETELSDLEFPPEKNEVEGGYEAIE